MAQSIQSTVERPASLRLHYLDGIRGLAALYVVMHHAYLQVIQDPEQVLPLWLAVCTHWLEYGSFSVAIFITLSGYCLMLPVARWGSLRGGAWNYIRRRAKRIIPPYYAAIAFSMVLTALFPVLQTNSSGTPWDITQPGFTIGGLGPHLLLVHNLKPGWIFKINYPMWSIAIEWQIYFFLPFVLLPIWKRFGLRVALLVSVLVGLGPHYLLHGSLDGTKPWYITLFSMGAIAAVIGVSEDPKLIAFKQKLPWGNLALIFGAILLAITAPQARLWLDLNQVLTDPIVGLFMTCLLIHCTDKLMQKSQPNDFWQPVLTVFSAPRVVGLGAFSYSLYLIHAPLLALVDLPLLNAGFSPLLRLGLAMGVVVPLTVAIAYLFYRLFERRFT